MSASSSSTGKPSRQFESINPATEAVVARYPEHAEIEIDAKLQRAEQAWHDWKAENIEKRAALMGELAKQLMQQRDELATLIVQEMGKPIQQARAEIEKCSQLCSYYQTEGPAGLSPAQVTGNKATRSYIRFEPLGAILAVMPWNFPFWQVLRFAVPSLLAGNVGVLKHATNVLGCASAIEKLFLQAGFPAGVFTSLKISRESIPALLRNPFIRAATLTGSEQAGVSIAETAGHELKKCVLELGGSDPFIVLPNTNMTRTIAQAVQARTQNNGQTCIAAKRFFVHTDVYAEFLNGMIAGMESLRIGDPLDDNCQLGPLARQDLREDLHVQVLQTQQQGAKLCTGGDKLVQQGWYYAPTVLSNVTPEMTAFHDETFGPVATVTEFKSLSEAVHLANQSNFGLGASIWTEDIERAEELATQIESGSVFINSITRSDPTLPFGGIKRSGYGRELGLFGLREFVNIKTVWIE